MRLANFCQKNKREGCNKRGARQKSPKLINREVGINGENGKNTSVRNFIEIKSSNDQHKKYKVFLNEESLQNLRLYMLINFMVIKNMYIKQFCPFA